MMIFVTGNGTPTKGFYYWDNNASSWIPISGATGGDVDWNVNGTSTSPTTINDNIYTQGNVKIGLNNTTETSRFYVNSDLASTNSGIRNIMIGNDDTVISYGIYNQGDITDASLHTGFHNVLSGTTDNTLYGIENRIAATGNGLKIAVRNEFDFSAPQGAKQGMLNRFEGGNSFVTGVRNEAPGAWSVTGILTGVENDLSAGGNGVRYGVRNSINGLGTGAKYGSYNNIGSTAGGIHYGVYSDVRKTNSYAGFFIGRMSLGTDGVLNRYLMPAADGTAGQVMTTDGSGNVTFQDATGGGTLDDAYDFGGAGAGRIITADNGAFLIEGEDGIQNTGTFGSGATLALSGGGTRMFFYPRKSAFRAGNVSGNQWNEANVGDYSFAVGQDNTASGSHSNATGGNNTASGIYSNAFGRLNMASGAYSSALGRGNNATGEYAIALAFSNTASGTGSLALGSSNVASGAFAVALGFQNTASGLRSFVSGSSNQASGFSSSAIGFNNTASGSSATAFGNANTAPSAYEFVVGTFNTSYTVSNANNSNIADRIFTVGNGTGSTDRSNALTIYKSGRMNINDAYNMPIADGTNGQVLTTDGAGSLTFTTPSASSGTLDEAYDFGGAGAGRIIVADNGAVDIQDTGGLRVEGDVIVAANIVHDGDANTFMTFTPDRIQFDAGGRNYIDIQHANEEITFNEDSTESDFRIESGTNQNMFFVDGSTNRIGIGTNTPGNPFHINMNTPFDLIHQNTGQDDIFLTGGGNNGINEVAASIAFGGTNNRSNLRRAAISSLQTGGDVDFTGLAFYVHGNAINQSPMTEGMRLSHEGFLGINNTNPSATLDVVGTMQFVDGNETNGYVLASDANGNATWTDPASLISNDNDWTISGTDQYAATSGNVGIGDTTPDAKLDIVYSGTQDEGVTLDYTHANAGNPGEAFNITAQGNDTGGITGQRIDILSSPSSASSVGLNINNSAAAPTNIGVFSDVTTTGTTNFGIFSYAFSATTNWAGYFGASGIAGSGNVYVQDNLEVGGQLAIDPSGTGYSFPTVDGANGQVLTTDGAGNVSFQAVPGDGTGTDDQNLLTPSLVGTTLNIGIENGSGASVNLSSLQDGTGTDDQTIDTFSFNSTTNTLTLQIEDDAVGAQTVNLSSLDGGAESTTASNGLTEVADDILLGGTLTQNTTINQGNFDMHYQLGSGGTADFQVIRGGGSNLITAGNDGYILLGATATLPNPRLQVRGGATFGSYMADFYNNAANPNAAAVSIRVATSVAHSGNYIGFFKNGNTLTGHINGNGSGGVNYSTVSDRRLKTNILDVDNSLELINKIQPRIYEYKSNVGKKEYGFIAQELQEAYPQAVIGDPNGDVTSKPMMVDYGRLTPILTAGVKELHERIKKLEKENEELKKTVASYENIEARLSALENKGGL